MITHSGDTSNLILDPDLDSYYLMDVTLLTLPQMEERLQQIAADVEQIVQRGSLSTNDQVRLAKSAALLREADWTRAAASARTALNEDRNFYGVSPTLVPAVHEHLARCEQSSAQLLLRLEGLASTRGLPRFDLEAFRSELAQLDDELYAFHARAFDEEDALLAIRIAHFRRSLHTGYLLAGLSVALSSLLAFLLASNVVRRVRQISLATEAFARGDMSARVGQAGADELGDLAGSFDVMADHIRTLTADLENRVVRRTEELTRRNQEFKLILDNAHEGMLTTDLSGRMSSERSAIVDRWFGTPGPNVPSFEFLAGDNAKLAKLLELGFAEIKEGLMPLEVLLNQLPQRMRRDGRDFRLSYQPIREQDEIVRVLVVVSDMTGELAGRRAAADQQEALRIFQACQRDRSGFLEFLSDARSLVRRLQDGSESPAETRRALHTLKGNCSLFGVSNLAELCHELENNLAETGEGMTSADRERLSEGFSRLAATVHELTGELRSRSIEVTEEEFSRLVEAVTLGAERDHLLRWLAAWKLEPASHRLERFAAHARGYAERIDKRIGVSVQSEDVRLCAQTWAPVWSSMTHLIRNAIDHGLETVDERTELGKPPVGELVLRTAVSDGRTLIEVRDDGRGVQWDRVREKARQRNLPANTPEELVEALFADGLSTRETVTEISGRGVGMSAVREAVLGLGGVIEVESQPGQGTTIRCSFPHSLTQAASAPAAP
jgi:two-component system chemotaxis sensor kinase CheA